MSVAFRRPFFAEGNPASFAEGNSATFTDSAGLRPYQRAPHTGDVYDKQIGGGKTL